MSRDLKIEKINAYQKLLSTGRIPSSRDDSQVSQEIQAEFRSWIESQLAGLLGESTSRVGGSFTDDEVLILKMLIKSARTKVASPQNKGTAVRKEEAKAVSGKPMPKPRLDGRDILSALDEMDRHGEQYLEDV